MPKTTPLTNSWLRFTNGAAALNGGASFAFDDVIDPADSRFWIVRALESAPPPGERKAKKRPNVDAW